MAWKSCTEFIETQWYGLLHERVLALHSETTVGSSMLHVSDMPTCPQLRRAKLLDVDDDALRERLRDFPHPEASGFTYCLGAARASEGATTLRNALSAAATGCKGLTFLALCLEDEFMNSASTAFEVIGLDAISALEILPTSVTTLAFGIGSQSTETQELAFREVRRRLPAHCELMIADGPIGRRVDFVTMDLTALRLFV